jgi:putative FmdB family regulatory protein
MPIYEYRCAACDHEFEALQKLSEAPLHTCPKCGKNELSKLVSAGGFQLKGSGWYATDFKNSGARPAAKQEPKSESKSEAKTEGGDAKPAATPAATSSEAKPKSEAPAAATPSTTPADT